MAKWIWLCRTIREAAPLLYLPAIVAFSLPLPKQTDVTCYAFRRVGYSLSGMNSLLDAAATLVATLFFGRRHHAVRVQSIDAVVTGS